MPIDSYLMKALGSRPDTTRKYDSSSEKDGVRSDGTEESDTTASDDPGEEHYSCAREMMDANAMDDHEGFAKALHSFIKMSK
jgi:hypothetical protein